MAEAFLSGVIRPLFFAGIPAQPNHEKSMKKDITPIKFLDVCDIARYPFIRKCPEFHDMNAGHLTDDIKFTSLLRNLHRPHHRLSARRFAVALRQDRFALPVRSAAEPKIWRTWPRPVYATHWSDLPALF